MSRANLLSSSILVVWLPIALATSIITATFYLALQQHIRTEANRPQVELAQDVAMQLFKNQDPVANLPIKEVDMASSLAPFLILYNSNGKATDGSGKLDGNFPTPPKGVFEFTAKHTEDHVTWEPKPGVRIAAVIRYYQNTEHAGFVLAGRNLADSEHEQNNLLLIVSIGWAMCLISTYLAVIIGIRRQYAPKT